MITLRRATLRGAHSTLTVLDCGHGVYFEVVDRWGDKLALETAKYRQAIKCIEELAVGDVFNEFITRMLTSGYKLESMPETCTENAQEGLKGAPQ